MYTIRSKDSEKTMTTWDELFDYLEELIKFGDGKTTPLSATCDGTLKVTREFCKKYGLRYDVVERYVRSFGGYCDCEILLNAAEHLNGSIPEKVSMDDIGPNDDELRPDDTWAFLAADGKPGWTDGFKTREDAEKAMNEMKERGIEIVNEPTIDINARWMRYDRKR